MKKAGVPPKATEHNGTISELLVSPHLNTIALTGDGSEGGSSLGERRTAEELKILIPGSRGSGSSSRAILHTNGDGESEHWGWKAVSGRPSALLRRQLRRNDTNLHKYQPR